jgi:hypothetical protein
MQLYLNSKVSKIFLWIDELRDLRIDFPEKYHKLKDLQNISILEGLKFRMLPANVFGFF